MTIKYDKASNRPAINTCVPAVSSDDNTVRRKTRLRDRPVVPRSELTSLYIYIPRNATLPIYVVFNTQVIRPSGEHIST